MGEQEGQFKFSNVGELIDRAKRWGTPSSAVAAVISTALAHPSWSLGFSCAAGALGLGGELGARLMKGSRRARIATSVLRFLTKEAFVVPEASATRVEAGVPSFRATVFWPEKRRGVGTVLVPKIRACEGGDILHADSRVFFQRGEPFAGTAWQQPGELILNDELKSLKDCGGDRLAWNTSWTGKGVPGRVVDLLGKGSKLPTPYIERVRSILSVGMQIDELEFVISIDSVFPNAFEDEFMKCGSIEQTLTLAKFVATELRKM